MSGRKRKSLWDSKEETEISAESGKHIARHGREIHSSHYAKQSQLEGKNALSSNIGPRWSSSEIWPENSGRRDYNETPKTERAVSGAKSYSRSPGFNGREKQYDSPLSEIYWTQSRRYQSSRSSSRSKGRARSRSRSGSRGRDREMDKDTDGIQSWSSGRDRHVDKDTHGIRNWSKGRDRDDIWSRERDRDMDRDTNDIRSRGRARDRDMDRDMDGTSSWSRGKDRDMDKDRDTNWSRSSLSDHRREHNVMGDRQTRARAASSQLCRDFSVGMCRRGDQCRFLHEDNLNLGEEGKPERERAQRLRGRQETGEAFSADNGRLGYRTFDKVSNYDRGNRSSFDHEHRRQPHKNGIIPCKYFAMGRCQRDDCRFSHDHPGGGGIKERVRYDRYAQHPDDKNKYRNGTKWGDAIGVSDMNINDWNDRDTGKMNYTDRTAKKQAYGRLDQDLKDENISWNGPKWNDVTGGSDVARPNQWVDNNARSVSSPKPPSTGIKTDERCSNSMDYMMWNRTQNDSNTANVDTFESTHVATFDREVWVNAQGSHIDTVDGTFLRTCEKVIKEASTQQLIHNVGQPLVSETFVQQCDSKRVNNIMSNDNRNALEGVSISENTKQLQVPEQIFNQNSGSSVSTPFNFHETDQRNVIPVSPSKEPEIDPNRSDEQLVVYPNRQDESKNLFEELTNKQQVFESEVPQVDSGLQNDRTTYQVAAITNRSASLNEILSNRKQLPEIYAALNLKNSTELSTSLTCSANVNSPVASTVGQPNQTTIFKGQHVPIGDTFEPSKNVKTEELSEQEYHGSDNKVYEEKKPTVFKHVLHSSTDMIIEGANDNKPYKLAEPKPLDQFLSSSTDGPDTGEIEKVCSPVKECQVSPTVKLLKPDVNLEAHQNSSLKSENCKAEEDIPSDNAKPEGRVREGKTGKDEKEMRLFKVALVEYAKEILKPTWKEGQMSREVHKSIVKKVVDKVTSTVQAVHVPKTQEKVDQYLACSKPKLTKLVQAYTERLLKS